MSQAPPSGADVLAELTALLDRQLELARDGRYEELTAATGQAGRLMADLADLASREPADRRQDYRQQLDRLRRVHRLLALTLADQHRDARSQVQKMRKGHGALRGYGRSG